MSLTYIFVFFLYISVYLVAPIFTLIQANQSKQTKINFDNSTLVNGSLHTVLYRAEMIYSLKIQTEVSEHNY